MRGDVELAINNWFLREEEIEPEQAPPRDLNSIILRAHPEVLQLLPQDLKTINQLAKSLTACGPVSLIRWYIVDPKSNAAMSSLTSSQILVVGGIWWTSTLEVLTDEKLSLIGNQTLQEIKNPYTGILRIFCRPPSATEGRLIKVYVNLAESDHHFFSMWSTDSFAQLTQELRDFTGLPEATIDYRSWRKPKDAPKLCDELVLGSLSDDVLKESYFEAKYDAKKFDFKSPSRFGLDISAKTPVTYCRTKCPTSYSSERIKAVPIVIGVADVAKQTVDFSTFFCHPDCPIPILFDMHKLETNPGFGIMPKSELVSLRKELRDNFSREQMELWLNAFRRAK